MMSDRIELEDLRTVMAELGEGLSDDVAEAAAKIWNEHLLANAVEAFHPLREERLHLEVLAALLLSFLKDVEGIDLDKVRGLQRRFSALWGIRNTGKEAGFRGPTPEA